MATCDFNYDVLFEILSRADLKTLRKCRILSRECNTLTYESSFMRSHCERTKTICGYLIQSLSFRRSYSTILCIDNPGVDLKLSFDNFLPACYVKILASVDIGLVFCKSQHPENQYYICKPTTQQWELIPSPNPQYFTTKFAMIVLRSNPLRFKIVRLSDNNEFFDYTYKSFHCEIFDSNIWAWKQSDDLKLSCDKYINLKDTISACGGLHWVTHSGNKCKVLSFHQDKESWELISVPDSCNDENHYSIDLALYEGKLAIMASRLDRELLEVWIMKDYYKEKSWNKKYSIDLEGLKKEIGYCRPVSFYNADTLLMLEYFSAIFYNFKNGRFRPFKLGLRHNYPEIVSFIQTDYEPIQLR